MRKKQYAWISLHIVIISILLYIGNRTCFLFLAENSEELSFLDKLMTGFLQTIDELSNISFHFTFDTRSLAGGGFLTLAYGLFVLYKVFDDKNVRPGEEYGSARWGKSRAIYPFIEKKKEFYILLTMPESLS